ncbi:hypothetical protein MFIFM68171_06628 [Madurella fahalii]|uniref:Phosphoglycerate mutase-like protein n=1 Tax=Madurella fahalii TaxID=1157608 RepID=A0ABQ0GFA2_9PEZI
MPPTLILVRHAQALHNVDNKLPHYNIHDPLLSELGREQCQKLNEKLSPRLGPHDLNVGLIIVSPMRRTIETALLSFPELIASGIPIIAHADWQENSDQPCDIGSPLDSLKLEFPQVDFSQVDPVFPDKLSPAGARYAHNRQAILVRGQAVLRELFSRPEKAVLVVSHSGFLRTGVTGHYFMNADYRIFEFDTSRGTDVPVALRQWEETVSGGMGWSWDHTVPLGGGLPDGEAPAVDGAVVP